MQKPRRVAAFFRPCDRRPQGVHAASRVGDACARGRRPCLRRRVVSACLPAPRRSTPRTDPIRPERGAPCWWHAAARSPRSRHGPRWRCCRRAKRPMRAPIQPARWLQPRRRRTAKRRGRRPAPARGRRGSNARGGRCSRLGTHGRATATEVMERRCYAHAGVDGRVPARAAVIAGRRSVDACAARRVRPVARVRPETARRPCPTASPCRAACCRRRRPAGGGARRRRTWPSGRASTAAAPR